MTAKSNIKWERVSSTTSNTTTTTTNNIIATATVLLSRYYGCQWASSIGIDIPFGSFVWFCRIQCLFVSSNFAEIIEQKAIRESIFVYVSSWKRKNCVTIIKNWMEIKEHGNRRWCGCVFIQYTHTADIATKNPPSKQIEPKLRASMNGTWKRRRRTKKHKSNKRLEPKTNGQMTTTCVYCALCIHNTYIKSYNEDCLEIETHCALAHFFIFLCLP